MKHIKIDGIVYHYNEETEEYISSDGHVAPHSFIVKSFANGNFYEAEKIKVFVFCGATNYAFCHDSVVIVRNDGFMTESSLYKGEFLEKLATEDFTVEEMYL